MFYHLGIIANLIRVNYVVASDDKKNFGFETKIVFLKQTHKHTI